MTPRCDGCAAQASRDTYRRSAGPPRSSSSIPGLIRVKPLPPVGRLPQGVRREVGACADRSGRTGPGGCGQCDSRAAAPDGGPDVLHLARPAIIARDLAAVDDVGIQRIGGDVAVFFDADRVPIAKGERPSSPRLATPAEPLSCCPPQTRYGKLIVGDDVIELRGRLVVPGAPGLAAVHGDGAP